MKSQVRMIGGRPVKTYRFKNYIGEDYITLTDVTPSQLPNMGAPDQATTYLNVQGKIYRWDGGKWVDFFPVGGGPRGEDGASAYQIALANGFAGSQAEWLASLSVKGDVGPPSKLSIGTVNTSTSGNATATITGDPPNQTLNLTVPQGNKGDPGPAVSLNIGTVRTVTSGSAAASIAGTAPSLTLNLDIPQGAQGKPGTDGVGIKGETGPTGEPSSLKIGAVSTLAPGSVATAVITGTAPNQTLDLGIPAGAVGSQGQPGSTTSLSIGTVTSLPAGQPATASISNNQLNIGIPAGQSATIAPAVYSNPTPVLNSAAQLSTTRDADVSYNVDVAITSLLLATTGAVFLEYADNAAMTANVVTVASGVNSVGGVLNITNTATVALAGRIPAGKFRRLRTQVVAGNPTFTARQGQEVLL